MPRIFDNILLNLGDTLNETLRTSNRADFCVGYFNLRGWGIVAEEISKMSSRSGQPCRLLVGMQRLPEDELRAQLQLKQVPTRLDRQAMVRLKNRAAEEFRRQLALGAPNNRDEGTLRRLAEELRAGTVLVRLHLKHLLHAKLYLIHRDDYNNPVTGFVGSSNLTMGGLRSSGELNVDVLEHDACIKLMDWYEARWNDSLDISKEIADAIDLSWARPSQPSPFQIYAKMAYHLSRDARLGVSEFVLPADFEDQLLRFQSAAVKLAAYYVNKRKGAFFGDVVGLGKTLMATALARMLQEDYFGNTLIICPAHLVGMWKDYVHQYRLVAEVLSLGRVLSDLPTLQPFKLVIIDESHNLRNREGRRFRAIQKYIAEKDSACVLLSATPFNKSFLDLSSQLRLFVPEDLDLGVRPERYLKEIGEAEFLKRHQCLSSSLAAFERSPYPEDWRDLMRLFFIRRTRTFIEEHYSEIDPATGSRVLQFEDGTAFRFPRRIPRTLAFNLFDKSQYAALYSAAVVDRINDLQLPRYGLGNYIDRSQAVSGADEEMILNGLSRAGQRLMGFCRVNLFKRLESGGHAFLQSVDRHLLRNNIFIYALENNRPLPIGAQSPDDLGLIDPREADEEPDLLDYSSHGNATDAESVYERMSGSAKGRFKWVPSRYFARQLILDLKRDNEILAEILRRAGNWEPEADEKLNRLEVLLQSEHPDSKILIFTQFADTANYLHKELKRRGVSSIAAVTGESDDVTDIVWRFSPVSSNKATTEPLRVLITTDVLSEGQNLQDAHIIVNYDIPWAIIRLVQRAGRVDRIGQRAEQIMCYTFLPAEGVDRIIGLRDRVKRRLKQNAEVVGSDEVFFEDQMSDERLFDLYHEKSSALDEPKDNEVDLSSYAFAIWRNAVERDPALERAILDLPNLVYSAKQSETENAALVYLRTGDGYDSLAKISDVGIVLSESPMRVLDEAACEPSEPTLPRAGWHHEAVRQGVRQMLQSANSVGGQLGPRRGVRAQVYQRLARYLESVRGTLLETDSLKEVLQQIYKNALQPGVGDTLRRQLKTGISDAQLATILSDRHEAGDLVVSTSGATPEHEPEILCTLGLVR